MTVRGDANPDTVHWAFSVLLCELVTTSTAVSVYERDSPTRPNPGHSPRVSAGTGLVITDLSAFGTPKISVSTSADEYS